jgi:predicted AAA+ superfamily ATPase
VGIGVSRSTPVRRQYVHDTAARCPRRVRQDVHTQGVSERGTLIPRKALPVVAEALSDTRVVTINGARQAGKSTLARLAADGATSPLFRLLDDPSTRWSLIDLA